MQAILTGGAAGTFLTAEHLDVPLTFEDFRRVGGTIGAGTVMVFDDTVDLRDVLARIGDFFAHESCGKCYPCQMGTQRQAEILRAHRRRARLAPTDAADLRELAAVMTRHQHLRAGPGGVVGDRGCDQAVAEQRWP